jgi:hypothetical protein
MTITPAPRSTLAHWGIVVNPAGPLGRRLARAYLAERRRLRHAFA